MSVGCENKLVDPSFYGRKQTVQEGLLGKESEGRYRTTGKERILHKNDFLQIYKKV